MHISVNKYDFQSVMGIRIRFSLTILSKIFRMEGEEFGMDRTAKHRGDPRTQRPLRRVRDGVSPPKGLHGNRRLSSQGGHSFFTHLTPSSPLFGIPVPFLVSRFLHVLLAAP